MPKQYEKKKLNKERILYTRIEATRKRKTKGKWLISQCRTWA